VGNLESHYRRRGESILIEMKLNSVSQLFNSLDPSPFHEKDLDDDAEEYIVSAAREFSLKTPLTVAIHLPGDAATSETESSVATAVHHYFEYRALAADRELRLRLRHGRASLGIGLLFLFACISARQLVGNLGHGTFAEILQEGLLISGWVAMWRPIQIFLYDWWPVRNLRELYRKLAHVRIEVRATA
jgi:hypothetical protein